MIERASKSLRSRISRHLTNQRTDAVAMNVLDPFEVAEIEVWPLDDLIAEVPVEGRAAFLDRAEFTVFQKALAASPIGAILNEKEVPVLPVIALPPSFRGRIIPENIYPRRKHPDVRAARRAATIAALARVISERDVSDGLRRTLLTQARRLEGLASQRLTDLGISATRDMPALSPPEIT